MKAAADSLLELGRDPKWLGASAQLGITAVLHTWTRELAFHPHVHCIVTGGGLAEDGSRWIAAPGEFLFPVRVLAALFRRLRKSTDEKQANAEGKGGGTIQAGVEERGVPGVERGARATTWSSVPDPAPNASEMELRPLGEMELRPLAVTDATHRTSSSSSCPSGGAGGGGGGLGARPSRASRSQADSALVAASTQRIGPEQRGQVSRSALNTCRSSHAQRFLGAGSSRSPSSSSSS
jgi:Putative transposase